MIIPKGLSDRPLEPFGVILLKGYGYCKVKILILT